MKRDELVVVYFELGFKQKEILCKAAISPRIVLVPIVPDPFFGRSAAFLRK